MIKNIDNDTDIRKLIKIGRNSRRWKLFISIIFLYCSIVLILYQFFSTGQALNSISQISIESIRSGTIPSFLKLLVIVVLIPPLLYLIIDYGLYIVRIRKVTNGVWKYLKDMRDPKAPRRPLDIWNFFVSNLSDSHSLIPATKLLDDDDIKYIFINPSAE